MVFLEDMGDVIARRGGREERRASGGTGFRHSHAVHVTSTPVTVLLQLSDEQISVFVESTFIVGFD